MASRGLSKGQGHGMASYLSPFPHVISLSSLLCPWSSGVSAGGCNERSGEVKELPGV